MTDNLIASINFGEESPDTRFFCKIEEKVAGNPCQSQDRGANSDVAFRKKTTSFF